MSFGALAKWLAPRDGGVMKFENFPKFASLSLMAGFLTLALAGCGGSSNLGLTQGNWAFSASSTTLATISGPTFVVGGNLTQSGNNLTGTMYVTQSGCIPQQFVNFTGTVKGKNVTLTSASFGGKVISVTASGTKDSLSGTYTVTGDCADSGTVTATAVPSITGTWNGTITNVAPGFNGNGLAQATLSVALSQATAASEDGTFALSGTLTYTNSVCSVSGTISNGSLAGNFIVFINGSTLDQDTGEGTISYSNVTLDSVAAPKNMTGDYEVTGGLCQGQLQSLTLTKQ
jgi:hypothetical protein